MLQKLLLLEKISRMNQKPKYIPDILPCSLVLRTGRAERARHRQCREGGFQRRDTSCWWQTDCHWRPSLGIYLHRTASPSSACRVLATSLKWHEFTQTIHRLDNYKGKYHILRSLWQVLTTVSDWMKIVAMLTIIRPTTFNWGEGTPSSTHIIDFHPSLIPLLTGFCITKS